MDLADVADGFRAGADRVEEVGPQLFDVLRIRCVEFRRFREDRFVRVRRIKRPTFLPAHVENSLGAVEIAADVLALVRIVTGKTAVLPLHVELVETEGGELVIRSVGGLFFLVENDGACDGTATGRVDALGIFFAGDPKNLVEPVDAPVAERAVRVIEIVAETSGMNAAVAGTYIWSAGIAAVKRSQRGRAAPHVPIELLRHWLGRKRFFRTAAVIDEAAYHADVAELSGADEVSSGDIVWGDPPVRPYLHDTACGARGVHHRATFHYGVTNWLLNIHMSARLHCGDHGKCVPVVGRADDYDLGLRLREEFAIVFERLRRLPATLANFGQRELELPRIDIAETHDLA